MATKQEIADKIVAYIIDNTQRKITPEQVREILNDLNESLVHGSADITHNSVSGLNEGNYIHLTIEEKNALTVVFNLLNGVEVNLQTQLDQKLNANATITGGTATKVTYDADGLVTAGANATTADINDSENRRYVTDALLSFLTTISQTFTYSIAFVDVDECPEFIAFNNTITAVSLSSSIASYKVSIDGGEFVVPTLPLALTTGMEIVWQIVYTESKDKGNLNITAIY
jgi:hypothetical protein